ncbi:MAG: hypothetical protein GXY34_01245 [Syntrophomonadaceae bacterium]|nr:hypothetical protein [Syntrophomonadaceae bacterium]
MIEYAKELFNRFNINEHENNFIEDTANSYTLNDRATMVHGAVALIFLSKQIEQSVEELIKSNEKVAKATTFQSIIMIVLTLAITIMTYIMVIHG